MPSVSYEELLTPMAEELGIVDTKEVEFDGKNMEAIAVLLEFLDRRLDRDKDKVPQKDLTIMVLILIVHSLYICCIL